MARWLWHRVPLPAAWRTRIILFLRESGLEARLIAIELDRDAPAPGLGFRLQRLRYRLLKNAFGEVRGRIDGTQQSRQIYGWLAGKDGAVKRVAVVLVDGREIGRALAHRPRADLAAAGIHDGAHAFDIPVPPRYRDIGGRRLVELVDGATGRLVHRCYRRLGQSRPKPAPPAARTVPYRSFEDYLAYAMLQPEMPAPFREEQKRVLAAMEGVGRYLRGVARSVPHHPRVSVIMPVFNRADHVATALRSLLAQTHEDFEVLVVDDGSTDNTCDIVRSLDDGRIRLIATGENRGPSAARNTGVTAARGDIVAYLDSDNWADPEWLETLVGAFALLTDADAVYTAQTVYDGASSRPYMVRFGPLNRSLLQHRNYIDMGAFAHRRAVHAAVGGFNEALKRGVDWDFILRIVETHRVYSVPVLGPNYRRAAAANTITADASKAKYLNEVAALAESRETARTSRTAALSAPLSVVIPNYEALESLEACISALERYHGRDEIEIIVVDNASDAHARAFLAALAARQAAKVVYNPVNYGFSHAVNQGVAIASPGRDIVLLNNDALVTAGALSTLQAILQRPDVAVAVPRQVVRAGSPSARLHVPFARLDRPLDVNLSLHHGSLTQVPCFHDGGPIEIGFAPFFCAMIKRTAFDRLGGLDAEFGRHFRSDRTFCSLARSLLGMKVMYAPDAVVFHEHQVATGQLRQTQPEAFRVMYQANAWEPEIARELGFREAAWNQPR
ncbi:MAG TPA: glycosyltransferase family 2 protein [Alphaproteobacteria bacterium]|nr:glycosyltransferase family 2 protein [Alphaproteobacteria bacterium]